MADPKPPFWIMPLFGAAVLAAVVVIVIMIVASLAGLEFGSTANVVLALLGGAIAFGVAAAVGFKVTKKL